MAFSVCSTANCCNVELKYDLIRWSLTCEKVPFLSLLDKSAADQGRAGVLRDAGLRCDSSRTFPRWQLFSPRRVWLQKRSCDATASRMTSRRNTATQQILKSCFLMRLTEALFIVVPYIVGWRAGTMTWWPSSSGVTAWCWRGQGQVHHVHSGPSHNKNFDL